MSKKESAGQSAKCLWDFPNEGVVVEASSIEEAIEKLEQITKSKPAEAIPVASDENEK